MRGREPYRGARGVVGGAALALLLGACGVASPASRVAPSTLAAPSPVSVAEPPLDRRLTDFHLHCQDQVAACPPSVGLLVRPEGLEDVQRCTVALIGGDRIVTASHCLLPRERHAGALCRGTWIALPRTEDRPLEWVACDHVERADPVDDEAVMRRDVALLRLARRVDRPALTMDSRPPDPGSIVTVLAVRPHPIYDTQHELTQRLCRVATARSAVETFGEGAARVGWLMDCPSHPGNSGSPILDARGHLRALMHAGSAPTHGIGITSRF